MHARLNDRYGPFRTDFDANTMSVDRDSASAVLPASQAENPLSERTAWLLTIR
jgi:hypothetical protein